MVQSYVSNKIIIKQSKIHLKGMFAIREIYKDEIVFIKGGHILKRNEIFTSGIINSYFPIDDEFFLGAINKQDEEQIKLYINHSCNPNCGLRGEITFIAMRDIQINEEVTFDYALLDNEDYEFKCYCNSKVCRGFITGYDWKRKDIQEKYYMYFAEYLKSKIDNTIIVGRKAE